MGAKEGRELLDQLDMVPFEQATRTMLKQIFGMLAEIHAEMDMQTFVLGALAAKAGLNIEQLTENALQHARGNHDH
jgi:hypothetical protein